MATIAELQNGRYHHVRLLGSGGMGEVYLMQDTRVSRQVAIKIIRSEGSAYPDSEGAKEAARLFQREARSIAALEHPNILPLYDFGEEVHEGAMVTYMVMPHCSEGSLASWLKQHGGTLAPRDVAYLVNEAAEGLQHAHDLAVIHLDVKPSNFLLRGNKKNPNHPTLLLADFGIARNFTTVASSSRTIRGTPASMAPEQWSSEPVPATDQYALAVMVYELLAGRAPFVGGMEQLMFQHFTVQPPPPSSFNPRLTADIDAVLLRALAKKPEDRFPSVTAFANAFEQAIQALPAVTTLDFQKSDDASLNATLAISPSEAEAGISRMITLPGGKQINVPIPAGTRDGQVIRVQDIEGATTPMGELLLTVAIKENAKASPSSSTDSNERLGRALHISDPVIASNPGIMPSSNISSGHDLPTLSAADPGISTLEGRQLPIPKRSPVLRFGIIGITSLIVIVLLLFGSIYFFNNRQNGSQSNTDSLNHAPSVVVKLSPTPTSALTATAPIRNGLFIADSYNGSMFDQGTQQTTRLTVYIVQTKGNGALSGSVTFRTASQSVQILQGNVDLQGNFSFSVQQPGGKTPLLFIGTVQHLSDGNYLKGNYCNSSTNTCLSLTGYFTVGPGF